MIGKSIIDSLGEAQKETILTQALAYLMQPGKVDTYTRKDELSPLEEAFNQAVRGVAQSVVRDYINEDDVKARVREVIVEAVEAKIANQSNWIGGR